MVHRVGPPHPISNMRPVIYNESTTYGSDLSYQEFQYTMHRRRMDAFHQQFWLDVRYFFSPLQP